VSHALKQVRHFVGTTLLAGVLLVAPIYLAILLLLKAMKSVEGLIKPMKSIEGLIKPLSRLLPAWLPGEVVVSLSAVLVFCFLIGMVLRTAIGQAVRARIENSVLAKIPGYDTIRGMTRQLAGECYDNTWRPALVEIEEALVPAFIVEEIGDGRLAVFVPSVPTPLAGSIYILTPERVHPLNVPFTAALKTISRWGSGSKELVAAMEREGAPLVRVK
jgi:uncharacterized membrane protein